LIQQPTEQVITMNEKHIIEILDSASLVTLSESQLQEIRSQAVACASCRDAYEAARLSAVVMQSRAQATIEPSPFFQTRVMAAWREQQTVESVPAFFRLWKSAKALVSTMALTTAALAVLSFVLPSPGVTADEQMVSAYSAESVVLGQNQDEQLTYEQVLSTIYEDDDEAR
jgi:hypothetical protein